MSCFCAGSRESQTDRQTDRETDGLIATLLYVPYRRAGLVCHVTVTDWTYSQSVGRRKVRIDLFMTA